MAVATLVAVAAVVALAEGGLRLFYRGTAIDPASGKPWHELQEPGPVKLLQPPPFVTDADGFLVAGPFEPRTNRAGYRTPEFDEPALGRPAVLFLGDSFTWGEAARPLNRAFVDLVREKGYRTINLGISATGPVQYLAQAERYLLQLAPSAVCVMLYPRNDFLAEPPLRPGLERAYMTNVGMLFATTPDGTQLTFDEAVARRAQGMGWWTAPGVANVLGGSAIGRAAAHWGQAWARRPEDMPAAIERLDRIQALAQSAGARFLLFVLPVRPELALPGVAQQAMLAQLADLAPLAPEPFDTTLYKPLPGEHFNNAGHARMAEFVAEQLVAAGLTPRPDVPPWPPCPLDADPTLDEFAAFLGLDDERKAAAGALLDAMNADIVTALFRQPVAGGASPGIALARLNRGRAAPIGLFSPEFYPQLLAQTPDAAYTAYAEIIDGLLTATFRQIAGSLTPDQLLLFKRIAPERLSEIETGQNPLAKALRR